MAEDQFKHVPTQMNSPARHLDAITPDDNTDLAVTTRGLYIGGAGNLTVIAADDTVAVLLTGLAVGWHPICAKRIKSTGTTATSIVGAR